MKNEFKAILLVAVATGTGFYYIQKNRNAEVDFPVGAYTPQTLVTNVMQSIGSQLLDCRIMRRAVLCIESGKNSENCKQAEKDILGDGIFDEVKNKKDDEITLSIKVDLALCSCKHDIGEKCNDDPLNLKK